MLRRLHSNKLYVFKFALHFWCIPYFLYLLSLTFVCSVCSTLDGYIMLYATLGVNRDRSPHRFGRAIVPGI